MLLGPSSKEEASRGAFGLAYLQLAGIEDILG